MTNAEQDKTLERIEVKLDELDRKLFRGNGSPAWSTRIDRLEQFAKCQKWFIGLYVTSIIGLIGMLIGGVMGWY